MKLRDIIKDSINRRIKRLKKGGKSNDSEIQALRLKLETFKKK